MRYISLSEVLELHRRIIEESGGSTGLRDLGGLESAIAQPHMTFGGRDLYPTLIEKAAALCFSLVQNHPFIDWHRKGLQWRNCRQRDMRTNIATWASRFI